MHEAIPWRTRVVIYCPGLLGEPDRPIYPLSRFNELDLADSAVHSEYDLSTIWAHLMRHAPIHRMSSDGSAYWVLSRHRDVLNMLRDSVTFTSERGNVIDNLLAGGDSAGGRMLVLSDARRHRELGSVIRGAFTPKWLAAIVRDVERNARDLVASAVDRGTCDFATDVAASIPQCAIGDMMGIPHTDRAELMRLTSSALSAQGAPLTREAAWIAKNEVLAYFADLAAERRRRPADHDLLSLLVTADFGGQLMPLEEVILNSYTFLLAGEETTRLAMTGGVRALAQDPNLWASLRRGELNMRRVVEELLRWTTPALHVARTATIDSMIYDQTIARGDIVTAWMAAANRDPEVFAEPTGLDMTRDPNPHLSFGYGPHFCLGSYLARAELTAVLIAMCEAVSAIELAGSGQRLYSNFLSGYFRLPVHMVAA